MSEKKEGLAEMVKSGLIEKISSLEAAINYVEDPKELERLQKDLNGAKKALSDISKEKKTDDNIDNIIEFDAKVDVESPKKTWSDMTKQEKFEYQLGIFETKLSEAQEAAAEQLRSVDRVVKYFEEVDLEMHPYLAQLAEQFKKSKGELLFTLAELGKQLSVKDAVSELILENFELLETINLYLGNPMGLPHLNEERDIRIKEFREGEIKNI